MTNEKMCELVGDVAVNRNQRAFAELFRYFAPRLKGFGLRRGCDTGAAEELVQETMLTVWRKASTFDCTKATVATWIFTIVRNKRIDMFRREGYPEVDLAELAEQAFDGDLPDTAVTEASTGAAVRAALTSLPQEQLDVINKAFYEDKSHREIADELHLPLGTVKSRIRLAMTRLRAVLPEEVQ